MKLHLVLLALLPRALCALQAVDPAELQEALQSKDVNAWVESVAARRNISTDAVRSNVQAITYHLEPASKDSVGKDPGSAGGGGGQAKLERRQLLPEKDYPEVYKFEVQNDVVTNQRLLELHTECRRSRPPPANSPFRPKKPAVSFWRASKADCGTDISVRVVCRLPTEFGPPGWQQNNQSTFFQSTIQCPKYHKCTLFEAHNFVQTYRVMWASCTLQQEMHKVGMVNNVPTYLGEYQCPIKPSTSHWWEGFGQTVDGQNADWTLFTGKANDRLSYSRSPTFLFGKAVEWKRIDPDYQPWLKFARVGEPATIRLYSIVL